MKKNNPDAESEGQKKITKKYIKKEDTDTESEGQKKITKKYIKKEDTDTDTDIDTDTESEGQSYKFVEVCSGAGGLSEGFINKKFVPLLLNDCDKTCCNTLKKNHKNIEINHGSFTDIDYTDYIDIDVFMGGVPCQSFSQAGKRKGLDDERGNLLPKFIEIVKKITPKVFLIENVKGLVTHANGETFEKIKKKIEQIKKYKLYHKIVNANDYGVAQKRERLIIIGVRNDIKKKFKFPKKNDYKPVLKDVMMNIPESEGYEYSESKKKIMELVPEGGCWVDLPENIQKEYMKKSYYSGGGKRGIARRLSMDKPSLTLTTSPCQKQTERCHPIETRPLNVKEYARIQSFSDSYIFTGSMAQKYKQIGNAVPVKLSEKIAESIHTVLS